MKGLTLIGIYSDVQPYSSDGEDKTFTGPRVKKGQVVVLNHLSVTDVTKSERELRIGIQKGDESEHWFDKQIGTNQNGKWGLSLVGPISLRENERPVALVVNPDSDDSICFSAFGLVYEYCSENG